MSHLIRKYFTGLSRNTFLLAFASFFTDISTEMLYPILPIFLMQTLNANGSIVGLIEGIAIATQNIIQGFSGWLSDKLQRRKSIALVGYFLAAISKPLMGVSIFWEGVLGARFLDRFGTGMRSAPRDALVAASVASEHRGKAFGLEGFGDNLGAFVGPMLAIFLLTLMHANMRFIFYLAVIPGLLAFFMVMLVKERRIAVKATSKLDIHLHHFPRIYWKYLLVTILFNLGNSSNAFLILELHDIHIPLTLIIFIYAGYNLIAAAISYPAGFLSDHLGRRNILLGAFIIFFIAYLGFALTSHILLLGLLFIFYGCYQGITRSVGKAYATDFVPEHLHASAIGWYAASMGLLQLFASLVAGLLWDHVSHAAVFFYGAAFAVIGSIALIWLIPQAPNKKRHAA